MQISVRSPKNIWMGLVYIVAGAAGTYIAASYSFGTVSRMGPGYFPTAISWLLILCGVISLAQSFVQTGTAVGKINWKAILLIIGSVVGFGFILQSLGLIVALFLLVLMAALASSQFHLNWRAFGGAIVFVILCALLFVKGLQVPMALVGPWLQPIVPFGW